MLGGQNSARSWILSSSGFQHSQRALFFILFSFFIYLIADIFNGLTGSKNVLASFFFKIYLFIYIILFIYLFIIFLIADIFNGLTRSKTVLASFRKIQVVGFNSGEVWNSRPAMCHLCRFALWYKCKV